MDTVTATDWNEVLNRFVSENNTRYDAMMKPFLLSDGRIVASNGQCAIVLNAGTVEIEKNDGKQPDILKIVNSLESDEANIDWPVIPEIEEKPCYYCSGDGVGYRCRGCDGTGEHECDCSYCGEEECQDCDGTGFSKRGTGNKDFKCRECNGAGKEIDEDSAMDFMGRKFRIANMKRFDGIDGIKASMSNDLLVAKFPEGMGIIVALSNLTP